MTTEEWMSKLEPYFERDERTKDIAKAVGLSEGRVSQIKKRWELLRELTDPSDIYFVGLRKRLMKAGYKAVAASRLCTNIRLNVGWNKITNDDEMREVYFKMYDPKYLEYREAIGTKSIDILGRVLNEADQNT